MAERWQQWMPFHIDRFRGSPDVQAMHPSARCGFLYLLASAWQTDDCTIANDPIDLATASGLGDELWQMYGTRILRKFEIVDGRLRNAVEFAEWSEAKAVFERNRSARSEAGKIGNAKRWGRKSDDKTSQNIATKTGTVTGTEKKGNDAPVFDAQAIAKEVQIQCRIGGGFILSALTTVIEAEVRAGADGWALPEKMAAAWQRYGEVNKAGKLQTHSKPESFFGDGLWRDERAWKWKKDHVPKTAPKTEQDPHIARLLAYRNGEET